MFVNPLIKFYLKNNKVYLENHLTHKIFDIDLNVLKIIGSYQDLVNTKDIEALSTIKSLKANSIILNKTSYEKITRNYSHWESYNWWVSLLYYLSTESIDVVDRKSSKDQSKVLKKYLEIEHPSFYKKYKNKKIPLEYQDKIDKVNLTELLLKRRTFRDFKAPIGFNELSNILHYSCKEITALRNLQIKEYKKKPEVLLKSLYSPFEIYLIVNNVSGLRRGIYHLDLEDHSLSILKQGNYGKKIAEISQGQMFIENASVVILISIVFKRYMFRYRQARAYRDGITTAAELAQLLIIYSTYFNIKAFETPALKDTKIQKLLGLEEWEEEVLYLLALGK